MYQPSTTPQVGKVALFYGLRAGLLIGIAQSVIIIYQNHGSYSPFSVLTTPLSIFLWVVAFLGAGYLASRQLGKTSIGTLAGLWAGIIGGLVTSGTILFELLFAFGYGYDFETILAIIAGSLTSLIFFVLFVMSVGCGLGALGGLIGQSFFSRTPAPAPLSQYQQKEPPQQQSQTK